MEKLKTKNVKSGFDWSLMIAGAIALSSLAPRTGAAATAPSPTPSPTTVSADFKELEQKYNSASAALTVNDMLGAYLGRCFISISNNPGGVVLSTVQQEIGADEGPLFPPTEIYRMALLSLSANYTQNDTITQSQIDQFWASPQLGNTDTGTDMGQITIAKNTASETDSWTETDDGNTTSYQQITEVRKGLDGYLYVKNYNLADTSDVQYCYCWEKLNPQ